MTKRCAHAVRLVVLALILASIASCATRTQITRISDEDLKKNLYYENVVFKSFSLASGVQDKIQFDAAAAECEASAVKHLQNKNVFKNVKRELGTLAVHKTLLVENTLVDLRIVSGAARFWAGAFAGRSHMIVKVKLIDAATGAVVAEEELKGAPNAMGAAYSAGGTDNRLPIMMGILVGDYVAANAVKK